MGITRFVYVACNNLCRRFPSFTQSTGWIIVIRIIAMSCLCTLSPHSQHTPQKPLLFSLLHTYFWIVNHTQCAQLRRSLPFVINIITLLSLVVCRVAVPHVVFHFWSFSSSRTFILIYMPKTLSMKSWNARHAIFWTCWHANWEEKRVWVLHGLIGQFLKQIYPIFSMFNET